LPPEGGSPWAQVAATWAAVRRQWAALRPGQRRALSWVGVLAALGLLAWAVVVTRGPTMAPLFTNLTPQDGAAILAQLQRQHVPYRLADGGATILVPQGQVDALRLELAGQGLPSQGAVGLSSVLNLPFGATDFTRQVAYQNALQDELAQTIASIQGVKSARVQIVLPQTATFGGASTPATAAVLVDLQPGTTLTPAEVAGIVHLVASSVEGLTPDHVTVIDQTGTILSPVASAAGLPGAGAAASQALGDLQVQQQFDQQLQTRLEQLLDQVFGPGNAVVQVSSQLNFTSGTVHKTLFLPAGSRAVLASMQELKQSMTGQGTSLPPAGTSANSLPPTYAAPGGGSSTSSSTQLTETWDVSQEQDDLTVAPGALTRLSVAVVVNGRLTPAQTQLVRSVVAAAVGYDPARRDQISVVGIPFNNALLNALSAPTAPAPPPFWRQVPFLAAAGVALLALLLLVWSVRRRVGEAAGPAPGLEAPPPTLDGLAAAVAAVGAEARPAAPEEDRVLQDPEDIARVIRTWLSEDA
jgi:flagellar M-ring protein FliF